MGIMETVLEIPAEHEANVFGQFDAFAKKIERSLHVTLISRDGVVKIMGDSNAVERARNVLSQLLELSRRGNTISEQNVNYTLALVMEDSEDNVLEIDKDIICHTLQGKPIKPKTLGQKQYVDEIRKKMIVFGLGPAGTGKTYLAMAMAITAFKNNEVGRIILTRPAIEAGEKLGFLPGDLQTFLLKCSGLLSPEDGSALSNIKEENLPSVVFLLAFLVLPTIWIPVYIVAYRLYRAIREANNPISIWGFSWMSASMLFSAMIAVSIETATKYTAKLLARELMLVAIAALFVPLSFAAGYVIDYIIDRWRFANRPNLEDHYHDSLSSRRNRYILAIFNFVFCLCLSILFEVFYFESTINNIYVLVVFVVILSLAAFLSIVASLLCIISFICEDEFALHGHHVIFHNGQKRKDKIIGYGLSAKSTYYQPSSRRRELIFEGWNTQEDGHGVSIRNADDFDAMVPKDKCGEIKLYAQWKSRK